MSDAKKKRPGFQIGERFVFHTKDIRRSPAFRALNFSELKTLFSFEDEWMDRGGPNCKGTLIRTHAQINKDGVYCDAIAPSIRVLTALGFYREVEHGRAGTSEFRRPGQYEPTYLPTVERPEPTDDWRRISTLVQAKAIAQDARRASKDAHMTNEPELKNPSPTPPPRWPSRSENRSRLDPKTGSRLDPKTGVSRSENRSETSIRKPEYSTRSFPSRCAGAEPKVGKAGAAEPEPGPVGAGCMADRFDLNWCRGWFLEPEPEPVPIDDVDQVQPKAATASEIRLWPGQSDPLDIPDFLRRPRVCG